MAGTITRLSAQKRTPDRVNVFLDGEFILGLLAIDAARLRVGQYLSDAEIEQLRALDTETKVYDRAIRFLSYRPRSQAEVQRYLTRSEADAAVIESVVTRLTQQGYLNDTEFARFWIENREQFRPKGASALRQELRLKGVDNSTIESAVADLDPVSSAYAAVHRQALRWAELARSDPPSFRRRLVDRLLRRGFGYQVARQVAAQLEQELGNDSEAADSSG